MEAHLDVNLEAKLEAIFNATPEEKQEEILGEKLDAK
jgi:hypothetical protein